MRRRRGRGGGEVDFWPGFTDVLAGMLLSMVFVLTLFAVAQAGLVHVVGGQDSQLRALDAQIAELRRLLGASEDRAQELQAELLATTALVDELGAASAMAGAELDQARAELAAEQVRLADLVRQLKDYLAQIQELNARLSSVEEVAENRKASISDLQVAMNRLRRQLAEMAKRLLTAEEEAGQKTLRVSELLAEMARKDQRIAELEELEKYTSEFLARMSEVFADNPNIKVVGDRFIFQSEVLFASGSADVNPAGQRELDKFARAFEGLRGRIPRDLDVNIQVQGHTDIDPVTLSDRYRDNWDLSTARALSVVQYLAGKSLPEGMMSAAGFGEHFPRIPGRGPLAKAQNRRIEIRITRR